jgi:hypothetical protein
MASGPMLADGFWNFVFFRVDELTFLPIINLNGGYLTDSNVRPRWVSTGT